MQKDIFGKTPEEYSISLLREHEPERGYWLAFSGGKDSVCILDLAKRAGVKFEAHYSLTTVDPPELVHFIRTFPEVRIDRPSLTMWELIANIMHFPPLRQQRWCCELLKESGGEGETIVTGVRRAESPRRAKRSIWEERRTSPGTWYLHPIFDWSNSDVWAYIRERGLPYCRLYDEGFHRIGCVLCPMSTAKQRVRDAARWPKIANAYRRAILRGQESRKALLKNMQPEEIFDWWVKNQPRQKATDCQYLNFEV